ncbi:MAG: flavoprotein [Alphaproteobacteria bacterium]|nr:MAG: flavoprotein [Alphaproteobacteria bacterium]
MNATAAHGGLPVAIIGAGPIGLAAAAQLAVRNLPFVLFESGDGPGAAIREWAHVTFFSPWRFNVDAAARQLLEPTGWRIDDPDRDPTGRELVEDYLAPLAAHPRIASSLRFRHEVVAVTRRAMDRVPSRARELQPFEITARGPEEREQRLLARAVIDASGTWRRPNPAGASGVPAIGERRAAARIRYGIPDVFGAERRRYAGRKVLVVGSGHSAMDSVLGLARLKTAEARTTILWAMRSTPTDKTFGGLTDDQLSSRGALGERTKALVDAGQVAIVAPLRIRAFALRGDAIEVTGESNDGERRISVDEVIVATGFRPDFTALSEIRLDLHPWLECPRALGPLIDPNEHSCGTVPPHGVAELSHPEKDFYIAGMKSYGRAPTFLMMTGYEQVRSIVAAIAGDWQAARETRLVLPETGVCEGPGVADDGAGCEAAEAGRNSGCCARPESIATT